MMQLVFPHTPLLQPNRVPLGDRAGCRNVFWWTWLLSCLGIYGNKRKTLRRMKMLDGLDFRAALKEDPKVYPSKWECFFGAILYDNDVFRGANCTSSEHDVLCNHWSEEGPFCKKVPSNEVSWIITHRIWWYVRTTWEHNDTTLKRS